MCTVSLKICMDPDPNLEFCNNTWFGGTIIRLQYLSPFNNKLDGNSFDVFEKWKPCWNWESVFVDQELVGPALVTLAAHLEDQEKSLANIEAAATRISQ